MPYAYRRFSCTPAPGLSAPEPRHPVAIVGAGPIGLAMAVDLATRGIASVVLDDNDMVSRGSRAICWSKRTLEIFDRLGIGERMLEKGVTWKVGRQLHGNREIYAFDLLPEEGHKYPAFINLQQYYVEEYLIERAREFPQFIDLRFRNEVVGHAGRGDHVIIDVATPDGSYALEARYLLACDGACSPTRRRMGLDFRGQSFDEHFLIVDVEMPDSPFPVADTAERWFWFDPPLHCGKSALLHKQPDDIYRIDLQLGPDSDPNIEATEEKVMPRLRAMVGDKRFALDWMSVYQFRCARLERFVHGRVIFVGDSAHVVSPFGARGGNGGMQDVDNLGWKLAAVLTGAAPEALLATYDAERRHGADENITASSRATNFMTPKTPVEALFRAEVLRLARDEPFARRLINSGRLSVPCSLAGFALQSAGGAPVPPGSALVDAPLAGRAGATWLVSEVQGGFTLAGFGDIALPDIAGLRRIGIGQTGRPYPCFAALGDLALSRYGAPRAYLFRPDGHVAAAFETPDAAAVRAALARASGAMLCHEVTT